MIPASRTLLSLHFCNIFGNVSNQQPMQLVVSRRMFTLRTPSEALWIVHPRVNRFSSVISWVEAQQQAASSIGIVTGT